MLLNISKYNIFWTLIVHFHVSPLSVNTFQGHTHVQVQDLYTCLFIYFDCVRNTVLYELESCSKQSF